MEITLGIGKIIKKNTIFTELTTQKWRGIQFCFTGTKVKHKFMDYIASAEDYLYTIGASISILYTSIITIPVISFDVSLHILYVSNQNHTYI